MSSEPKKKPSIFQSPLGLAVLAVILAGGLILGLLGCKPKPHDTVYHQGGEPRDVVTVFFSKYQGNQSIVEDVIRKLPADAKSDPLKYALTELLKGPTPEEKSQGFYTEIPKGTRLLSLRKQNDAVDINLSRQFSSGGGSTSIDQRFKELKETVYSVDSSHKINLSVEGKPLELLGGEGLEVQESLNRDPQ